jgi:hypothetical protein
MPLVKGLPRMFPNTVNVCTLYTSLIVCLLAEPTAMLPLTSILESKCLYNLDSRVDRVCQLRGPFCVLITACTEANFSTGLPGNQADGLVLVSRNGGAS